jgi:predicted TIM-barrel fold metal-dependent hydrolase
MRIDTATSFWKATNLGQLSNRGILDQDYLPAHLGVIMMEHGLNGVIAAQDPRRNSDQVAWLAWMESSPEVLGALLFASHEPPVELSQWAQTYEKLKGVRVWLPDGDERFEALSVLRETTQTLDLTLEIGFSFEHWQAIVSGLIQHPMGRVILCPTLDPTPPFVTSEFHQHIRDINATQLENVWLKLDHLDALTHTESSGSTWEDSDDHWLDASDAVNWVAHCLEHWGPDRLLWGSTWPLLTERLTYDETMDVLDTTLQNQPESFKARILGANAVNAYGLLP